MNTLHPLVPTLAAAFVGHLVLVAQAPPPVPPPETPAPFAVSVEAAQRAVAEAEIQIRSAGEQVRSQLEEANRAVQLAQATHAVLLAGTPEPPEPPGPPEADSAENIEHSIQLWNADDGGGITAFGSGGGFGGGGGGLVGFGAVGPFGGGAEPLIVPEGEAEGDQLSEIREDLTILARILRKAAGHTDGREEAMGIMLSSLPGLRQPQAMYLGGYGAVFVLNVQFPLAPPPEVDKKPSEKPGNTAWDEARREIYGAKRSPNELWIAKAGPRHEVAYDAERVARLKRELIEALKNASNLRHVPEDEVVVVAVASGAGGGAGAREFTVVRVEKEVRSEGRSTGRKPDVVQTRERVASGPESKLVLRVKKADADAYAAGKLDHDAFTKRVTVSTY